MLIVRAWNRVYSGNIIVPVLGPECRCIVMSETMCKTNYGGFIQCLGGIVRDWYSV